MAPTRSQTAKDSKQNSSSKSKSFSNGSNAPKQWVFFANDDIVKQDENTSPDCHPVFCKLRHPRTGTGVSFLASCSGNIYELECFDEKFHSWFIGQTVHSGGQIYLTSLVDPLYLILPYLASAEKREKFMDLDQIVTDEDFPACGEQLLNSIKKEQLGLIADHKECDDLKFYRYSKDKTLHWLKAKVEQVSQALESQNVDVCSRGAHSAIFVSSKSAKAPKDAYTRFAVVLIGDKISMDLEAELKEHLGISPEEEVQTLKSSDKSEGPPAKRAKTDSGPIEDYSIGVDPAKGKSKDIKLTAAQKSLSKVDKSGMKSIFSFFKPKN